MKKIVIFVFVVFCLFAVAAVGYADYEPYTTNIKEGLDTMIKSPQPLVDSIKEEYNAAEFKPFGIFGGIVKGSFYAIKEVSTGVFRILTFNVDDDNVFANLFK